MELETLKVLLNRIHGATFATLDTETWATKEKSIRKVSRGERVIIFRTNGGSGYEGMVKRRLEEAGINPDSFKVGPLPWGERVDDLPLISCNGNYYLQCIQTSPGEAFYFLGMTDQRIDDPSAFGVKRRRAYNQMLSPEREVLVNTYRIDGIQRIAMLGEEVFDTNVAERSTRSILKISTKGK